MKIFIDVDNTILEHSGFYSIETESRIHSSIGKFPNENENAIKIMYESSICRNPDIVKELFLLDNVYILTKYPAMEYEIHKQKRVAQIIGLSHEELMNLTDSNGVKKYIFLDTHSSKVSVVKSIFNLENLWDCILVDDYSTNLIEWENNKGIAIKYYNEYNSPSHPIKGLSISNFKIFSHLLNHNKTNNLMVSCEDSYILNSFVKSFNTTFKYKSFDILEEVYHDLKRNLQLDKIDINTKYNLRQFLIEYYNFHNNLNSDYWNDIFKEKIDNRYKYLFCASFDTDLKKIKNFEKEESLALKIIEHKKVKTANIYDVYLTIDENAFLDSVDISLEHLINLLSFFLAVGDV